MGSFMAVAIPAMVFSAPSLAFSFFSLLCFISIHTIYEPGSTHEVRSPCFSEAAIDGPIHHRGGEMGVKRTREAQLLQMRGSCSLVGALFTQPARYVIVTSPRMCRHGKCWSPAARLPVRNAVCSASS